MLYKQQMVYKSIFYVDPTMEKFSTRHDVHEENIFHPSYELCERTLYMLSVDVIQTGNGV